MPRKYRPPAARRRKSKRPAPYFVEPTPQDDGDAAVSLPDEATSTIARVDAAPATPGPEAPQAAGRDKATAVKHISRDYSYVRAEVKRIVLVAGFLVISLIVTAILRN